MGYKMLKGDVIVTGNPLMVRVTAPGCPQKDRPGDLRLYRCVCADNKTCSYFLAFDIVEGKGRVKCVHPGAEDAEADEFVKLFDKGGCFELKQEEEAMRRIITVGDVVRYRGHVDTVKAIYAGTMRGVFECAGGTFQQARALLVLENDSGHYPVGDDIELLLPEGADEEGRYPSGETKPPGGMEYVCKMCNPSVGPGAPTVTRWCFVGRTDMPHVLVSKTAHEPFRAVRGGCRLGMEISAVEDGEAARGRKMAQK